jgi:hypothetical protein
MRDDFWEVLTAPADALPLILGTEDKPSTIPAPEGGWGTPGFSEDGKTIVFGVPKHHITPELRAAWPNVKGKDRKVVAQIVEHREWQSRSSR